MPPKPPPTRFLHALILFRQLLQGLRAADLREHIAGLSGRDAVSISQGAITYQLRRLRLHGLIERIPKTFRYRVVDLGLQVALFFTRTYNRRARVWQSPFAQARLRRAHRAKSTLQSSKLTSPIQT
jgi:hypothetical protein